MGYFEQGLFGDRQQQGHAGGIQQGAAAAEERQSLLSQVRRGLCWVVLRVINNCNLLSAVGDLLMASSRAWGQAGVSPRQLRRILRIDGITAQSLPPLQGQANTSSSTASKQHPGSSSSSGGRPAPAANGHAHSFDVAAAEAPPPPAGSSAWQPQQPQSQPQAVPNGPEPSSSSYTQSKFDSLDYEVVENTVYRTDAAGRTHLDHIMEAGVKWTICFALGKGGSCCFWVLTAAVPFCASCPHSCATAAAWRYQLVPCAAFRDAVFLVRDMTSWLLLCVDLCVCVCYVQVL